MEREEENGSDGMRQSAALPLAARQAASDCDPPLQPLGNESGARLSVNELTNSESQNDVT